MELLRGGLLVLAGRHKRFYSSTVLPGRCLVVVCIVPVDIHTHKERVLQNNGLYGRQDGICCVVIVPNVVDGV